MRAAALTGFVLVLAGCHPAVVPAIPANYLRVDIDSSPLSLDPRYATDAVSARIDELLFDSLLRLDQNGRFTGDLAASFEWRSPTALVFHLRPGVRLSDGRLLTARDVKYTYDSVLDPASLSPKRGGMEELAGVDAPDDSTVILRTRRPYAPALELGLLNVVPADTPAGAGASRTPLGSGPFRLAGFVRDEWVILARNPYHPYAPGAVPGVAFKVVPDPTVCALELLEGSAQFTENDLPPALLGYLRDRPRLTVSQSPGTSYQYLQFNFRDPRLRDLRVRQAIAMAIDRPALVRSLLYGTARVASGMLAPENWAYTGAVRQYPYDPAAARRMLDRAGYRAGADGLRFTLVYKTTQGEERMLLAQALAAMLRQVGIGLRIRSYEWPTFYSDIQRGNFDLTSLAWIGITDPHHYFLVFDSAMIPPRGLNRGDYVNPRMDALLAQGDATIDPNQRRAIYAAVQQLAAEDLPYVSLWWQDNVAVMASRVGGFKPYPNGSLRSLASVHLGAEPLEAAVR
ncbi:MAG TPA: ABC transporter substrate-binding protein [Candidatus Binataceae bacterium]|nr:ABC transporter substrate-binding protein [Candidatus Binataceae bacterium]